MFFRMIHINQKPRCQWECIIPLLGLDLPIQSGDLQLQEVCVSWSLKNFQFEKLGCRYLEDHPRTCKWLNVVNNHGDGLVWPCNRR